MAADLNADCAATEQAVEFVAISRLRRDRSPDKVQALFRKADLLLDSKIADAQQGEPSKEVFACRPGCDHCCHRVVFSSILEAIDVAAHVEKTFSEPQKNGLKARLRKYLAEVGPHMGQDLATLRVACPMLEGGLCSVYDARPFLCRSQFSTNVDACIQARSAPSSEFPVSIPEDSLGLAAKSGLTIAMDVCGLWSHPVDFARAVNIALDDPRTSSMYLNGLKTFELAAPVQDEIPPPAVYVAGGTMAYRPNSEPTGMADDRVLQRSRFILQTIGDPEAAFETRADDGPLQQMFRVQAPMAYKNPDEIEYWRNRMEQAFEEFASSPFDPCAKFDAITAYNPLSLSYQQKNERDLLSRIGDYLSNEISATVLPDLCAPIPKRRHSGKLRVGYIGTSLGNSSGAFWTLGWLKNHSPDVESWVFYLGAQLMQHADLFKKHAHRYFHCPGSVPEVARLIKQQNLDVLIYPDPTFDGRSIQFATLRLAPIQCAGWGDPETTGLPNIDYFLSSDWMEPEGGEAHYRERLVRLPKTGVCYPRLERWGSGWNKAAFGLDDGPLLLCNQAPSKMIPQRDELFKEICDRTGRPIVFFSYPNTASRVVERRLKEAGVRALFMPFLNVMQFYDLVSLADATLDTVGWSGGITTMLALQQRRPVITLPGEFRRGRHAMAFLKAANAPNLIATDPGDYVDLVVNTERRHEAMRDLTPEDLFDDMSSVVALEVFLQSVAWD